MSGAISLPRCQRCGKRPAVAHNPLIGGWYCAPCDAFIRKPDPHLEAAYYRRFAKRHEANGASKE